jgi:glycosyltransferase involved in cell wall biosynthesis
LVSKTLNIDNVKMRHISNPNIYKSVPRLRQSGAAEVRFGYIGRLELEKGIKELLSVMKDVAGTNGAKLIVAGTGALASEVDKMAEAEPWLTYLGWVPGEDVANVLDSIDYLVIPSLWAENFPGIAIQAGLAGVPVIAFDVGGISEIVINETNGLLVSPGNIVALTQAILRAIDNREMLSRLSQSALELSSRFDVKMLIDSYVDALEWLLKHRF